MILVSWELHTAKQSSRSPTITTFVNQQYLHVNVIRTLVNASADMG
jgi:hypothetical protein